MFLGTKRLSQRETYRNLPPESAEYKSGGMLFCGFAENRTPFCKFFHAGTGTGNGNGGLRPAES